MFRASFALGRPCDLHARDKASICDVTQACQEATSHIIVHLGCGQRPGGRKWLIDYVKTKNHLFDCGKMLGSWSRVDPVKRASGLGVLYSVARCKCRRGAIGQASLTVLSVRATNVPVISLSKSKERTRECLST